MEDHYNDNILLGLVKKNFAGGSKAFFDPNTIAISKLSLNAYCAVLAELGTIIARVLMEELILKTNFNEWGALLLHQEVVIVVANGYF